MKFDKKRAKKIAGALFYFIFMALNKAIKMLVHLTMDYQRFNSQERMKPQRKNKQDGV